MNSHDFSKVNGDHSRMNLDLSKDKASPKIDQLTTGSLFHPRKTRRSYSMVSSLDKLTNKLSLMDVDKKKDLKVSPIKDVSSDQVMADVKKVS
jgi:hypothetical protein